MGLVIQRITLIKGRHHQLAVSQSCPGAAAVLATRIGAGRY